MRMNQGLQARRGPLYFGIVRPELLEEDPFLDDDSLLASERIRKERKPLFGFLSAESEKRSTDLSSGQVDPTGLSRANKIGGR